MMGYVEQMDIHTPAQTVIEALLFSARLRLPKETPQDKVGGRIDSTAEGGRGRGGNKARAEGEGQEQREGLLFSARLRLQKEATQDKACVRTDNAAEGE